MDRPLEQKRWSARRVTTIGGAALACAALAYLVISSPSAVTVRVDPSRLTVARVLEGEFLEQIPILGTVEPIKSVYIAAIEGGQVAEILAEDGSQVAAGTAILRLENADVQKEAISTESRLFENLNELRNTRINLEEKELVLKQERLDTAYRITQLEKQWKRLRTIETSGAKVLSETELENVVDELDYQRHKAKIIDERIVQERTLREQQLAQVDDTIGRVQRNLGVINQMLDNLEVHAPITGQLSLQRLEIGQNVVKGDNIGQIDILDSMKVRARVDQYYVARVAVGQRGYFEFDGARHELEVAKIYPEIKDDVFEVDMNFLTYAPGELRRGQSLRINLALSAATHGRMVSKGGFYQSTGGRWIYQIAPDGASAYRREIRIGRQNEQFFEVLDGLEPGALVITSNYDLFGDAQSVEFAKPLEMSSI